MVNLVLVGSEACGKTSLINAYVHDTFSIHYSPTIEERTKITRNGFQFEFVDTSGKSEYLTLVNRCVSKSDVILLCYSVADYESFVEMQFIAKQRISLTKRVVIIALQCDVDLKSVSDSEGIEFAKSYGAKLFFTSAKNKVGVQEPFTHVINLLGGPIAILPPHRNEKPPLKPILSILESLKTFKVGNITIPRSESVSSDLVSDDIFKCLDGVVKCTSLEPCSVLPPSCIQSVDFHENCRPNSKKRIFSPRLRGIEPSPIVSPRMKILKETLDRDRKILKLQTSPNFRPFYLQ